MSHLKVGILGGGFMGRTHATAARANGAQVSGILSSSPDRTRQVASELGVKPAATIDELIERVDVVHVCTPNALHAQQAARAIEAGRHVVCEKPLALDHPEAVRLAASADRAGVVATIPFVYRFHPMVRHARQMTQQGALGRLLSVRGAYLQDWMHEQNTHNWRVPAGTGGRSRAFGDIGSHLVDMIEFVSGERIARLNAHTSISFRERAGQKVATEDVAAVTIEMDSGAIGSLMVSQVNAGRKNQLTVELAGTMSSLFFDQEHPDELWNGCTDASRIIPRDPDALTPDGARLSIVPAGHPMGYTDAFTAFVGDTYARIDGRSVEGLPSFADGMRANQLIDAVIESAATGQWVHTSNQEVSS